MKKFPKSMTYEEKYGPAMKITDPKEAQEYYEMCVRHTMGFGKTHEEAEGIEKSNIGYYAGYYSHETRLRVEKLFGCVHPIFGSAEKPMSAEDILRLGECVGRSVTEES